MEKSQLPEAPVSINTNLKSEAGFEYQLTLRGESYTKLLSGLKDLEAQFKSYGLTPLPKYASKQGFPKKELEYVEGRKCPECGARLVKSDTKKGKVIKCETNKYDFQTKKATGCPYVEWPKPQDEPSWGDVPKDEGGGR